MTVVDVIKSAIDALHQISEEVNESIVYLDAGCTESFNLIGAFPLLLKHGARAVCCLENLSPCHMVGNWNAELDFPRKVVVMTSCLLSDSHRYTLRCLSSHPTVQQCYIFTSISEVAHSAYPDSPLGPDAYREYELLLTQDYEELTSKGKPKFEQTGEEQAVSDNSAFEEGWDQLDQKSISQIPTASFEDPKERKEKLNVSVLHFPMILCPLSPKCFVLPSGGSVAQASLSIEHEDSLSPGLPPFSTGVVSDGEDVPPGATLTANFLYYLASKMDLKFEIFSFGDVSKTVGRILTDMSSLYDVGRRKRSAGLLLVDRTLDLLTPCCHGDSLFDRMFSALRLEETPPPPTHTKSSQPQGNMHSHHLHRAPLDVRIPLSNILDKDSRADNFQLLEGLESVLCGWDSSSPDSKIQDLINLSSKIQEKRFSDSIKHLLDGSFVVSENFRGTLYLEAILDRKMKDGAVLVKRWLQETLRRENISLNMKVRPGIATKSDLEVLMKALAKSDSSLLRNKGIIQLAAGAIAALDESHGAKWDAFISAEKMLRISAGDTSQSLAAQIGDLINKSIIAGSHGGRKLNSFQGLISFNDALLLTIIGYILAGENFPTSGSTSPFSWQEEHLLKEAIVDAIFENPELAKLNFVRGLVEELVSYRSNKINSSENKTKKELSMDDFDDDQWGNWGDEESDNVSHKEQAYDDMQLKLDLRDRVDNLFRFLHKLSGLKSKNKVLRDGPFASGTDVEGDSLESKGLLHKLLTRVLDKHEVPGLEHHSSAVGRLFKSGFGRFGLGQAKPSIADHNVILVFVIGGTNGVEVREAFEALSESGRPDIELIMGGTTLLTPDDMLELLLGNSSYL